MADYFVKKTSGAWLVDDDEEVIPELLWGDPLHLEADWNSWYRLADRMECQTPCSWNILELVQNQDSAVTWSTSSLGSSRRT